MEKLKMSPAEKLKEVGIKPIEQECLDRVFNYLISKDKKQIEIKNFLGGKKSHLIKMQEGCTVAMSTAKDVKNELIFEGIDNAKVSLCCAQINGVCKIKQKDERKFLDGIFVSSKELVDPKDD